MTVDFDIIVTYCNHPDPHYFTGLSYDPAANGGAGSFVTSDEHSGQWLRDEEQAREQFEQAKARFAAKRNLTVSASGAMKAMLKATFVAAALSPSTGRTRSVLPAS